MLAVDGTCPQHTCSVTVPQVRQAVLETGSRAAGLSKRVAVLARGHLSGTLTGHRVWRMALWGGKSISESEGPEWPGRGAELEMKGQAALGLVKSGKDLHFCWQALTWCRER